MMFVCGREVGGGEGWGGKGEGYKIPKLLGMIAEPIRAAHKIRETGRTRALLK